MNPECSHSNAIGSLLVFSDDWRCCPSSSQHLISHLVDRYPVLWVNSISTRQPRPDLLSVGRLTAKLRQWADSGLRKRGKSGPGRKQNSLPIAEVPTHPNLQITNVKTWPWFRCQRDREINRWLLAKQLSPLILQMPKPVVAFTTLAVTADLPGELPVDRWVYYHVDDFSKWPGLNAETLQQMDYELIQHADLLIASSESLQAMIAEWGRSSSLLTPGVDVDFWTMKSIPGLRHDSGRKRPEPRNWFRGHKKTSRQRGHLSLMNEDTPERDAENCDTTSADSLPRCTSADDSAGRIRNSSTHESAKLDLLDGIPGPLIVFWGVIDRRLDLESLRQLSIDLIEGTIVLIGPQDNPDSMLLSRPNVYTLPAQPLPALRRIAEMANVLIMPYGDLPVTQALQPLELKEFMATGRPVVVNRLPFTDPWSDCIDVADGPEEFSQLVRNRIYSGVSPLQSLARCRLQQESWNSRAERLEHIMKSEVPSASLPDNKPRVISFKSARPLRCS